MNPNTNITNTTTTVVTTAVTSPIVTPTTGGMDFGTGSPGVASRVSGMYSLGMIASTIDDFTGKNVVRYLEKFEQRAELDGWTEEEAIKLLKFKSTGEAHDLWASDPTLRGLDFKTLKARLIERFSTPSLPGEVQLTLSRCYQHHDESVASFCTRLRVLGSKLLKEDIKKATALEEPGIRRKNADLLLNQFKLGLRKEIMKEVGVLLLREENLSLDKAEELVKLQETTMKMVQGRGQDRHVLRVNCYNCGKEGHIARECRKLGNEAKKIEKGDECFLCRQRGHWAKECPKRNFKDSQASYRENKSYATVERNFLERQDQEDLRNRTGTPRSGEFYGRQVVGPGRRLSEGSSRDSSKNENFKRFSNIHEQKPIRRVDFEKRQEIPNSELYETGSRVCRGNNGSNDRYEENRVRGNGDGHNQVAWTDTKKFVPERKRNQGPGGITCPNSLN